MQEPSTTPRRHVTPQIAACVLGALLWCLAGAPASARPVSDTLQEKPQEKPQRIGRFLADKALTPTGVAETPATLVPATAALLPAANPDAPRPNIAERVRNGASDMVLTAMNFLGVPYKRGGASEEAGFDCSGFTRHIFETSMGLVLPRKADQQAHAPGLVPVKRDELRPGDLVFFNTLKRTFSHVGIYVGEGKFIHAPKPGGEVRVEEMSLAYWKKRFTGARRAEGPGDAAHGAAAAAVSDAATAASTGPAAAAASAPTTAN